MRLKNFFQLLATALVTSVLLIGCKSGFNEKLNSNKESIANQDTVQPITLDMVSINSNKRTVALGESLKLYATAYFSDNKHETVTELVEWSIEGDKNISIDKMTGEVTTLAKKLTCRYINSIIYLGVVYRWSMAKSYEWNQMGE
uniref:Ig-like domain-containing protein n=1 Tax=Vibrio cholerae TaxID=666 RepID=UPI003F58465D